MSRNTRRSPQANWVKLNKYQLRKLEFENDIKLDILSGKGKEYELIGTKNKDEADSLSTRKRIQREKKGNSYEFRLMLDYVQESDSGVYACLVRNKYGSDYRKFFVHVKSTKGEHVDGFNHVARSLLEINSKRKHTCKIKFIMVVNLWSNHVLSLYVMRKRENFVKFYAFATELQANLFI